MNEAQYICTRQQHSIMSKVRTSVENEDEEETQAGHHAGRSLLVSAMY